MALSSQQIEQVRLVVSSSGWNDVMKPALANRAKAALSALTLTPEEREARGGEHKHSTDEYLRALIHDTEWMLGVWTNELMVDDLNRRRDELDRATFTSQNGS